jgi:hypothetical protein
MQDMQMLDMVPLWVLFVFSSFIAWVWLQVGFLLCTYRGKEGTREPGAPVGSMVSASLALLAFMLGFTYNVAQARFEERRLLIVDEANAIGTAYLRADFLEEPGRGVVKQLLRQYAAQRTPSPATAEQAISASEELQQKLWAQTAAAAQKHPNWPVYSTFITAMNDVIDIHSKRVASAFNARIPLSIWLALFAIGSLAMIATGYYCGMTGDRSGVETMLMILSFMTVLFVVADLDRPFEGSIRAPQQPLIDLNHKLGNP